MLVVILLMAVGICGATPFSVTINFNEYPFPTVLTDVANTTLSVNVLNDTTGSLLAADNGDLNDLTFSFTTLPGQGGQQFAEWQTGNSGRFTTRSRFGVSVTENNPGLRNVGETTITFGAHMNVSSLSANLVSLNTRALTWQYTLVAFLRPDGSYFSPMPEIQPYLLHTSINDSPSAGWPSVGWFVSDSTSTVQGVGTDLTSLGSNGPFNNMVFSYALAGLATGTQVGGLRIIKVQEDVRGVDNGASISSASITSISFSGEIFDEVPDTAIPEPSATWLCLSGVALLLFRRFRRAADSRSSAA